MNTDEQASATSRRADEIFFAALEFQTTKEQIAFMDKACAGDAALRKEVNNLHSLQKEAEHFFADTSPLCIEAKDLLETLTNSPEFQPPASPPSPGNNTAEN